MRKVAKKALGKVSFAMPEDEREKGLSTEDIMEITGLTLEEVHQL